MNIPLKTIDTDGVMAKKKSISTVKNSPLETWEDGYNFYVAHNETLTLDMDAEKMAIRLWEYDKGGNSDYKKEASYSEKEVYRHKSKHLLSNPAAWMKLGINNRNAHIKCGWCKDTGRRSIGSRPSQIPCDMCSLGVKK